jgi:hypothetical protein
MFLWKFQEGNVNKEAVFSPLNGEEPNFSPRKWNTKKKLKKNHNCYAYMLDIISDFQSKPPPGYASGHLYMSDNDIRSCDKLFERIKSDNPSVIPSSFKEKCPKGYRKGYFAVDTSDNPDYHFYRLDKNGTWSHKPGSTDVIMQNFDGKMIINPERARRESNSHFYDKSCGFFCFDPTRSSISNRPKKKIL